MPPLLFLSPVAVDHSFPRDADELRTVAVALSAIAEVALRGDARLIITPAVRSMIDAFDWNPPRPYAVLTDVHRMLAALVWKAVLVDLAAAGACSPHVLPSGLCGAVGFGNYWADDAGKLLVLHDRCADVATFFIGIACELAFAAKPKRPYGGAASGRRAFPIVGPGDLVSTLSDAYSWDVPQDDHQRLVMQSDIRRNFRVLGGLKLEPPQKDSHCKIRFGNGRFWTFSVNDDPIPEPYLKQLVPLTGFPFEVVRAALLNGRLPPRRLRLTRVTTCTTATGQ